MKWIPIQGRESFCPFTACVMMGRAMLMGIANPIPWAVVAVAVLMPITWPAAFTSAPPELPGLIAASVWIKLWSQTGCPVCSSVTWIWRPRALMIPEVTLLVNVPSGLPMAIASWPGCSVEESPIRAAGSPALLILTIARSVSVSVP